MIATLPANQSHTVSRSKAPFLIVHACSSKWWPCQSSRTRQFRNKAPFLRGVAQIPASIRYRGCVKSYLSGFHLIKRVMHAVRYNAVYRLTSLGPKPDYSIPWEVMAHVHRIPRCLSTLFTLSLQLQSELE